MKQQVVVIGAGTMGAGIALHTAQQGYPVRLYDSSVAALERAEKNTRNQLETLVQKGRITAADAEATLQRLTGINHLEQATGWLIIEAVVEQLDVKQHLFAQLAAVNPPTTLLATNTSSLSVTSIQEAVPNPGRVAGLHYFNPAPLMRLVEIVQGKHTSTNTLKQLEAFCLDTAKVPVHCTDAPGFIVNRVARHYYLEALHLAATEHLEPEVIDGALESAGFKMGPFKLMDLIGLDINYAVSTSVYNALGKPPRLQPSALQGEKVAQGKLGRKTGEGFYRY